MSILTSLHFKAPMEHCLNGDDKVDDENVSHEFVTTYSNFNVGLQSLLLVLETMFNENQLIFTLCYFTFG
jgi:hypothetical protein